MAYVEGELGQKIKSLMDEGNEQYNKGEYEYSIQLLIDAWNELPDEKYPYDESFLILWGILNTAIVIKNTEIMNQWVDKIFFADPERGDTGEREMWAGRVAYESNQMEKALEYFKIAYDKSGGRCFGTKDIKYLNFLRGRK